MKSSEFENNFLAVFAKNISKKQLIKNKIRKNENGYLWNIFGNGLVKCFQGNDARFEFDKVDKYGAIEIQYDNCYMGDEESSIINNDHYTAKGIDDASLIEFYVIGKDFSWCYVVTHALDGCGPFFAYAPQE